MDAIPCAEIAIVIPTYGRERVLLDTIECLLRQNVRPAELLIVDQTVQHEAATCQELHDWEQQGAITLIRLPAPSVPLAMNTGLRAARQPLVLFLDDDIRAGPGLVAAHLDAHRKFPQASAVVGQIIQPNEPAGPAHFNHPRSGLYGDLFFPFWSTQDDWVSNVMAGNLSVRREAALAAGGFDENFTGVAFRFETEFARRLLRRGGKIRFYPAASIHHLHYPSGGTRSKQESASAYSTRQGAGDYYFAFLEGRGTNRWHYILGRLYHQLWTDFYLHNPWRIPAKVIAEFAHMLNGWNMARKKRAGT